MSLVLLSATLLVQSSGVQAQVVVDPDSPAGKEYAIPLEETRKKASGSDDGGSGGGNAASFGEGIQDPSEADAKSSSKGKSSKDKNRKDRDKAASENELDTVGAVGGGGDSGSGGGSGPDEAGANGALLTSGIALAVLLLGGGIAFLMRRGAFGTD